MPLVLSLREGQDFFVGDEEFVVDKVVKETDFTLIRVRDKKRFTISETEASEVLTDVFVSAGEAVPTARIAIDAHPSITILRGEKYRKPPARNGQYNGRHPERIL